MRACGGACLEASEAWQRRGSAHSQRGARLVGSAGAGLHADGRRSFKGAGVHEEQAAGWAARVLVPGRGLAGVTNAKVRTWYAGV